MARYRNRWSRRGRRARFNAISVSAEKAVPRKVQRKKKSGPSVPANKVLVVPVNTHQALWAARAFQAIIDTGKPPEWMTVDGRPPNFGVLAQRTWPGVVAGKDGWHNGIINFANKVQELNQGYRSSTRHIVKRRRGGDVEVISRPLTFMDRTPAQVMGTLPNGTVLVFVLTGFFPNDQSFGQRVFPFYLAQTNKAMEGIVLAKSAYPNLGLAVLSPDETDDNHAGADGLDGYLEDWRNLPEEEQKARRRSFSRDWRKAVGTLTSKGLVPRDTPTDPTLPDPVTWSPEQFYGSAWAVRSVAAKRRKLRETITQTAGVRQALRKRHRDDPNWQPIGKNVPTLNDLKGLSPTALAALSILTADIAGAASESKKTLNKWEDESWKLISPRTGSKSGLTPRSIPWVAIDDAAFTVYGINTITGNYEPISKPVLLSGREILRLQRASFNQGSNKAGKNTFNALDAVLRDVCIKSGLGKQIRDWEAMPPMKKDQEGPGRSPPIPFKVMAAVTVSPRVRDKLGRAADVGWGSKKQVRRAAGLPSDFRTAAGRNGIELDDNKRFILASAPLRGRRKADGAESWETGLPGIQVWRSGDDRGQEYLTAFNEPKSGKLLKLARELMGVEPEPSGRLMSVTHVNLFGMDRIAGKGQFKGRAWPAYLKKLSKAEATAERMAKKAKKSGGTAPTAETVAYYQVLERDLGSQFQPISTAARSGRASVTAGISLPGHMGVQASKQVAGEWKSGVKARRKGEATTRDPLGFGGVHRLAARIMAETEELPDVDVREHLHPDYGIPPSLLAAMEQAGIPLPKKRNRKSIQKALLQLQQELTADYAYEPDHGQLRDDASPGQDDFLAELNPSRRPRRKRRVRRRERRSRYNPRNPMDEEGADEAAAWLRGGSLEDQAKRAGELEPRFERERQRLLDTPEDITDGVRALFQTRKGSLQAAASTAPAPRGDRTFSPEERLRAMAKTRSDVIGSLEPPVFSREAADLFKAIEYPWRQEGAEGSEALSYLSDRMPLSLTEVGGILSTQQQSKKGAAAMQASSAICRRHRTQRVGYMYGGQIEGIVGRNVLIMMSPTGQAPRVMTFKRGVHMDCDLTGQDMGTLTGLAIQGALLWMASKPTRKTNGSIWLGRVGSTELYQIWSGRNSQAPISLADVQGALRATPPVRISSDAANLERERYIKGVHRLQQHIPRRYRRGQEPDVVEELVVEEELPPVVAEIPKAGRGRRVRRGLTPEERAEAKSLGISLRGRHDDIRQHIKERKAELKVRSVELAAQGAGAPEVGAPEGMFSAFDYEEEDEG